MPDRYGEKRNALGINEKIGEDIVIGADYSEGCVSKTACSNNIDDSEFIFGNDDADGELNFDHN